MNIRDSENLKVILGCMCFCALVLVAHATTTAQGSGGQNSSTSTPHQSESDSLFKSGFHQAAQKFDYHAIIAEAADSIAKSVHGEALETMKMTLQLWVTIASVLILISLGLNGYFGAYKPEMDRRKRDAELEGRVSVLDSSRSDMENLTLALANLNMGSITIFENRLPPTIPSQYQSTRLDDQLTDPAIAYFSMGLNLLTQLRTTQVGLLKSIYIHALRGVQQSAPRPWSANEQGSRAVVARSLSFLESHDVWRRDNEIARLVGQIRELM